MLLTLCLNPVLVSRKIKKDRHNTNSRARIVLFSSLSLQEFERGLGEASELITLLLGR
jgi:hypothetical protein